MRVYEVKPHTYSCEGKFPISGMVVVAFAWSCAKAAVAVKATARMEKRILTEYTNENTVNRTFGVKQKTR